MTDEYEPLPPWPDYGSLDPAKVIKRRADLHVGAVAFVRDENHRVYRKEKGRYYSYGCPIPRYHFVPVAIVGETRVSWISNYWGRKFPKKNPVGLFGADDVENYLWVGHHKLAIADAIRCDGALSSDVLREVARLIGYKPEDTTT